MPILKGEDLTTLVSMIDRQLERKRSLEARERSLEQQLMKWRMLLVQKMATENPPCQQCRPQSSRRPDPPECECCVCGSSVRPARPKSSRGYRSSRSKSPREGYSSTTQWKNDGFGASSCQPQSQTVCLCTDEREPVLARLAFLADDEIRIMADIEDVETRIMTTCDAICALKQVVLDDDKAVGAAMANLTGAKQAAIEPSPSPVPQELPKPATTAEAAKPPDVAAIPPDVAAIPPDVAAIPPDDAAKPDAADERKSSVKEASVELDTVRKSLDGVEDVVNSHTSKGDLSNLKESLNDVEVSIMSAHFSLAATPLPDQRQDSIVSYKTPTDVIEFWNEIESTKHRLSVLVKHSQECAICKDSFKSTFKRIDEELLGLSEELRQYHANNKNTK